MEMDAGVHSQSAEEIWPMKHIIGRVITGVSLPAILLGSTYTILGCGERYR